MSAFRLFRHGPLLVWTVIVLLLVAVTVAAASAANPQTTTVAARTDQEAIDAVSGWRASIAQMPVAIADGSYVAFATSLAAVASQEAERTKDANLAAAWTDASAAAAAVAGTELDSTDALYAGLHGLSLAGDRLAIVVNGLPWIAAPLPSAVPVGPLPQLSPGVPGPAGPGLSAIRTTTDGYSE